MLQRRHYLKISESAELTHRTLAHIHIGPEHNDYYNVASWFDEALRIMTPIQRAELLKKHRQILDDLDINPKDLGL